MSIRLGHAIVVMSILCLIFNMSAAWQYSGLNSFILDPIDIKPTITYPGPYNERSFSYSIPDTSITSVKSKESTFILSYNLSLYSTVDEIKMCYIASQEWSHSPLDASDLSTQLSSIHITPSQVPFFLSCCPTVYYPYEHTHKYVGFTLDLVNLPAHLLRVGCGHSISNMSTQNHPAPALATMITPPSPSPILSSLPWPISSIVSFLFPPQPPSSYVSYPSQITTNSYRNLRPDYTHLDVSPLSSSPSSTSSSSKPSSSSRSLSLFTQFTFTLHDNMPIPPYPIIRFDTLNTSLSSKSAQDNKWHPLSCSMMMSTSQIDNDDDSNSNNKHTYHGDTGYHRTLQLHLENCQSIMPSSPQLDSTCSTFILFSLPPSVYLDPYQISYLAQTSEAAASIQTSSSSSSKSIPPHLLSMHLYDFVDIEAQQNSARGTFFSIGGIKTPLSSSTSTAVISLPLHLRYSNSHFVDDNATNTTNNNSAQLQQRSYTYLHSPALYYSCPSSSQHSQSSKKDKNDVPSNISSLYHQYFTLPSATVATTTTTTQTSSHILTPLTASVPVGNLSLSYTSNIILRLLFSIVSVTVVILCLVCTFPRDNENSNNSINNNNNNVRLTNNNNNSQDDENLPLLSKRSNKKQSNNNNNSNEEAPMVLRSGRRKYD